VLDLYNAYGLVREDADVVNELAVWPQSAGTGGKASSSKKDATVADLAVLVSTKTKGAFTRALNKCTTRHLHFAHSAAAAGGGRKRKAVEGISLPFFH
jgi:hypothetical protein